MCARAAGSGDDREYLSFAAYLPPGFRSPGFVDRRIFLPLFSGALICAPFMSSEIAAAVRSIFANLPVSA